MKEYDSYKKSKFQWFDKIPEHWIEGKIKYLFEISRGRVISQLELKAEAKFPVYSSQTKNDGCLGYIDTFDYEGEMLTWTTDGANAGSVFQRKGQFNCTNVCGILTPTKELGLRYYFYYVDFIAQFYKRPDTNGAKIMSNEMAEIHCFIPSLEEQTKIAAFLDYKTNLIDATIEKKKRLIELLKEKRQAVINEAVTKGLNPNVPMKDSGVEWLGEIPDNWNIRNFDSTAMKNQYSFTGGPFGSDLKSEEYTDSGVRIIQLQNIGVGVFKDDYKIYTSEEKAFQLSSCLIFPGDIIIAKMADPVARACIIPNIEEKYIMASDGIRLEVDEKLFNTKFVEYSINSIYFNSQAESVSTGTTRLRIGLTVLKKLKILVPPVEEQNLIVEQLMIQELKINSIVSKLDSQIQKLQTYRQSLISETVTGKIDVRDWQNPQNN